MTTYGELVTQIRSALHSYTGIHETVTWLASGCDASVTTLTVNDGTKVSIGISELEEELIYVSGVDANTLTLAPFGRGYRGSAAATHATNALVTFDPLFPAVEIKNAINQVIAGCYPKLYRRKETTFTFSGSKATWELPADCDGILKVQYSVSGPSGYWPVISRWEFEPNSELPNGKALTLHEPPEQGRTVKVTYRAAFGTLSATSDTLTSVGFPESAVDVVLFGVAARLIRFLSPARLQLGAVENISRGQLTGPGDPAKLANDMYAMYATRLEEERRKLLDLEPPQMHFTR